MVERASKTWIDVRNECDRILDAAFVIVAEHDTPQAETEYQRGMIAAAKRILALDTDPSARQESETVGRIY